ncbi:putative membrane protein [Enhydrobacter aerosaccus]|uniref:Putative membrane protein n=1 Tax=Enhydrobacter aerosaccus TaxID=225324 RepID=A0A1T4MVT1_9HYPH|nr:DUF202 domain-containing protein [Enhydrobacter aerosaccus]SJZ71112.1 putative membrane protein [Enhydrobacter aerosaccus]
MTDKDIRALKEQQQKLHHVSEHLANERTILAWIRTSIAVMTFGVAINRFSLFLIEFGQAVPGSGRRMNVHAEQLGIGLVVLGVLLMIGATFHYLHVANTIDNETYRPSRAGIIVTALAVLALGGTSLVWLL